MGGKLVKWVGLGAFYVYLASLFGLGLLGLLAPGLELGTFYGLSFSEWGEAESATLLHQYRILKAFVIGFALYGWLFRKEIFEIPRYNYLFLFLMLIESAARPLSLFLDGSPTPKLLGFMWTEFLLLACIAVYSRARLSSASRRGP